MKLNENKCHLMIFGNKCNDSVVTIGNSIIKESDYEKLLGVTYDKKLSFTKHVEDLCKKANQNLHALARLCNYIDPVKLKLLMDAFINSQFNYCPLLWMFHDRKITSKVNKIRERAVRIVSNNSGNGLVNNVNSSATTAVRDFQNKERSQPTF